MIETGFSYGKLLIQPRDQHRAVATVYVSEPPAAEAKSLGRIFFVAQIQVTIAEGSAILNAIQEEFARSYYGTDDLHVEKVFEKSLEMVNQRIADLVGDYDTDWLNQFSAVAAAVTAQAVHLSTIGRINAYLIRANRITDILAAADTPSSDREMVNPLKAFSNIISGDTEPEDLFLFTTPALLDYFSLEKLRRTVIDRHPSQAASQLQSLLSENENKATFATAIVQIRQQQSPSPISDRAPSVAGQVAPTPTASYGSSDESMQNLLQKQADTGNILSPSLSRYVRERLMQTARSIGDFIRLRLFRQSPRRIRLERDLHAYQNYHRPTSTAIPAAQRPRTTLVDMAHSVSTASKRIVTGIGTLARKRPSVTDMVAAAPRTLGTRTSRLITSIQRLPRVSKILIAMALVVAFGLAQGIYSTAASKFSTQQQVAHEKILTDVSESLLRAEAALTYDNITGAKELLASAEASLAGISDPDQDAQTRIEELTRNISVIRQKTQRVVSIDTPVVIANIAATSATARPAGIAQVDDRLYTYDPASGTIYQIALDGTVTPYTFTDKNHSWIAMTVDGTDLLLLTSALQLSIFDTDTGNLTEQPLALPDEANITDTFVYDGRYYLADIYNNQILKANGSSNGYGTPSNWLKDDTTISTARSLAIDGFIYILKSDGTVVKLLQGNRQDWSLESIEPALSSGDSIWTTPSAEHLYVLDRSNRRVISFTKDGTLVFQYTSDAFNNLLDLTIDPTGRTAYILNGTTIASFPLE